MTSLSYNLGVQLDQNKLEAFSVLIHSRFFWTKFVKNGHSGLGQAGNKRRMQATVPGYFFHVVLLQNMCFLLNGRRKRRFNIRCFQVVMSKIGAFGDWPPGGGVVKDLWKQMTIAVFFEVFIVTKRRDW